MCNAVNVVLCKGMTVSTAFQKSKDGWAEYPRRESVYPCSLLRKETGTLRSVRKRPWWGVGGMERWLSS